jgi:diacylglycerol O-acyltransferase / wax synthase
MDTARKDCTVTGAALINRATPGDVVTLAMDFGPVPSHVGAVLRFTGIPGGDPTATERLVAERAGAVPRLRQRLIRAPLGCGPPVWVDDPAADPARHVRRIPCPAPGDDRALLDLAARVMTTPLPRTRPLWSATVVTGLADGAVALLVVLHHVMADGVGGLAVLSALTDGAPDPGPLPRLGPAPTRCQLGADAMDRRRQALRRLPASVRSLRQWLGAAGGSRPDPAAACTLIGPVGRRRRYEVVRTNAAPLRAVAHRHGATVNDAVLVAVTGALRDLLAARGEAVDPIAVGVPVSLRRSATAAQLGNEVAPILLPAPVTGDVSERLGRVAAAVRTGRAAATQPPPAGVATAMWWAARLGLLRRYMTHQRRMHTMVSSIHGPDGHISVGGSTVESIVPLVSAETGNVRISFDVLSYAGSLTITAVADPDSVPDLTDLAAALREELATLAARPAPSGEDEDPGHVPAEPPAASERARARPVH